MLKALLFSGCLLMGTFPLIEFPLARAQESTQPSKRLAPGLRSTTEVIEQVCHFIEIQKAFSVDLDIVYDDVLSSGQKVQYSAYQKLWVQRPNHLRSDYVGDKRNTRLYFNGKTLTLEAPESNNYATKAAPQTIDEALAQFEKNYGITIPMSNLAASKVCSEINSQVERSIFIGTDMVNRESMIHILMTGKDRDFQIWVTRDSQPLLRKAIINYKNTPGSPQYTVLLSRWNFKPQISDKTFNFSPPEGAKELEILPR